MSTKSKVILAALALTAMNAFAACADDDNLALSAVPKQVQASFVSMFPKAKGVEWEKSGTYYVADFTSNMYDVEAWFGHNGNWAMTETDYGTTIVYLPQSVQTAFMNSAYSNAIIDDVTAYERVSDNVYTIEVENNGPDVTLIYDTYGNLLNTVNYDVNITPYTVISNL